MLFMNDDKNTSDKSDSGTKKLKVAKYALTATKWVGKATGIVGGFMKNLPGTFTELAGVVLEGTSDIVGTKISDKIEKLENPKDDS